MLSQLMNREGANPSFQNVLALAKLKKQCYSFFSYSHSMYASQWLNSPWSADSNSFSFLVLALKARRQPALLANFEYADFSVCNFWSKFLVSTLCIYDPPQGQGMGIPVGKLSLYTVLGGVRPSAPGASSQGGARRAGARRAGGVVLVEEALIASLLGAWSRAGWSRRRLVASLLAPGRGLPGRGGVGLRRRRALGEETL